MRRVTQERRLYVPELDDRLNRRDIIEFAAIIFAAWAVTALIGVLL